MKRPALIVVDVMVKYRFRSLTILNCMGRR
jgi:hypothetical protein